jgi:hypothetical protein
MLYVGLVVRSTCVIVWVPHNPLPIRTGVGGCVIFCTGCGCQWFPPSPFVYICIFSTRSTTEHLLHFHPFSHITQPTALRASLRIIPTRSPLPSREELFWVSRLDWRCPPCFCTSFSLESLSYSCWVCSKFSASRKTPRARAQRSLDASSRLRSAHSARLIKQRRRVRCGCWSSSLGLPLFFATLSL